ncbi:MAG: hypothetical protein VX227_00280 [Nitrospinota bacterium]|nr:hypothetical protein [Nitrospinota bacterium]
MIEQYLQVAIEFFKEIWFQLNTKLGLEETQAFKFLKPYLLEVRDNPIYTVIAISLLVLLPYSLYKIKSTSRKNEKKLNELMEEMEDEEEFDKDDPRRLRRSDQGIEEKAIAEEDNNGNDKKEDKPFPEKNDIASPPDMQILEKMDEGEKEDEFHLDTQRVMGSEEIEFEIEPNNAGLAEQKTNEELDEFEEFEFDAEPNNADNISTNDEHVTSKNSIHDENLGKDQISENKPTRDTDDLINRLKYFQENLETRLQEEETQDPGVESIANDLEKNHSFVEQENFAPKTPKVSPLDKKKYMEVLESFIFLKDQNKR